MFIFDSGLSVLQALPAYQRALDLNAMSTEIIAKVRELKKKVQPKQPKVCRLTRASAAPLLLFLLWGYSRREC